MSDELLYFNGINGTTGDYGLPPMSGDELAEFVKGTAPPENLAALKRRYEQKTTEYLGVKAGVDPKKLGPKQADDEKDGAGWGIVFAHNADPAIKEALEPLLALRREQAGDYFYLFEGPDGVRPNQSTRDWLRRHDVVPEAPADPEKMPYYLLLVGSPKDISYRFQYQLDVQYAVGRIYFDTLQEYATYAASVVAAERGEVRLPRRVSFFSPANPNDGATNLSTAKLVEPLAEKMRAEAPGWTFDAFIRDDATKDRLSRLLSGDQTPALLFTASHGMEFPNGDERQLPHQGALLCQDWPGPKQWRKKIPRDFYFACDDLDSDASVLGLISFNFACYGAGTPQLDAFARQALKNREPIAPRAFLAQLPTRMLGHPRGGALATVGHVERTWSYSFMWPGMSEQTTVFESTLNELLDGYPVGAAIEYFNDRYAALSTELATVLDDIDFGLEADPYTLAGMWTANNDARNYVILGDPAVRLPVADTDETPTERPTIRVNTVAAPTAANGPSTEANVGDTAPAEEDTRGSESGSAEAPASLAASAEPAAQEVDTVTISTYAGDDPDSPGSGELVARTTISPNGDVEHYLSTHLADKHEAYLDLHKKTVTCTIEARRAREAS